MKKLLYAALAALFAMTWAGTALAQVPQAYQDTESNRVLNKPVTPSTPLPIRGQTTIVGDTFTTPAGVTAYTAADLIANSATAGSVTPMSFSVCLVKGGNGAISVARVKTADTGFAGKKVILKLYKDSPTVTNGDNGAWLSTESNFLGSVTVKLSEHFSGTVEKGFGIPDLNDVTVNGRQLISFDCAAGAQVIYGLLTAGEAATPQGAKAWTVVLETLH